MPRAGDAFLRGELKASHDPNKRIAWDVPKADPAAAQANDPEKSGPFKRLFAAITGNSNADLGHVGGFFSHLRDTVDTNRQEHWDTYVQKFSGWPGRDFPREVSEQALADLSATISGLSNSVTALQNSANNQSVGGVSTTVDFTSLPSGATFGSAFNHLRSGGAGHYSIVNGQGAVWSPVNDADTTDAFLYNALQTTTDYQKIWVAFSSAPQGFSSSGRNEIHGRKNSTGDTYVYAALGKSTAELGCVVAGTKTVFTTKTSGFSFKPSGLYALECGTVGNIRIFRLLEGSTVVLTWTEVGTTSQLGTGYRYAGGLGFAHANAFGTNAPGSMGAFALSDNYPATVTGSGAKMYRTSTALVGVSAGSNLLPSSFFSTLAENSSDITCDTTNGKFTVSVDSWYDIDFHTAVGTTTTTTSDGGPVQFKIVKTTTSGTEETAIGDALIRNRIQSVNFAGGQITYGWPPGHSGSGSVYLQAGNSVQIGYDSDAAYANLLTGEASGKSTFVSITRTGVN